MTSDIPKQLLRIAPSLKDRLSRFRVEVGDEFSVLILLAENIKDLVPFKFVSVVVEPTVSGIRVNSAGDMDSTNFLSMNSVFLFKVSQALIRQSGWSARLMRA
jgi:hypothetical protein